MGQLPKILIIDDDLGRATSDTARRNFCRDCRLTDITGDVDTAQVDEPIAEAVFCSSQVEFGDKQYRNEVRLALKAVQDGIDKGWVWALILLDINFSAVDGEGVIGFGYTILDALLRDYSDRELYSGNCIYPVIMLTAYSYEEQGAQANIRGADGYVIKNELKNRDAMEELLLEHGLIEDTSEGDRVIGRDLRFLQALRDVRRAARYGFSNILLLGDSGSGKSYLARYIHRHSDERRAKGPFRSMALSKQSDPALLRGQLFGYWKGAHSHADRCTPGLAELASDGTLFLDEVANLDEEGQRELLEFADHVPGSCERWLTRMGNFPTKKTNIEKAMETLVNRRGFDDKSKKVLVDALLVTATNAALDDPDCRAQKGFRPDLYWRLQDALIKLPPLQKRGEDIVLLFMHFLDERTKQIGGRVKSHIDVQVRDIIMNHNWPGNVRELASVANYVAFRAKDFDSIHARNLPKGLERQPRLSSLPPAVLMIGATDLSPKSSTESPLREGLHGWQHASRQELRGQYQRLNEAHARDVASYLKAALEATREEVEGNIQVQPAIRLMCGDAKISTTKAADFIKSVFKICPAILDDLLKDDVLNVAYSKAWELRPARNKTGGAEEEVL